VPPAAIPTPSDDTHSALGDASTLWLRRLSRALDDCIPVPGTRHRIGLDPLLGLVPGLGDIIAGLLGTLVLFEAVRRRLPRMTQLRITLNILIDTVLGAIPVVGDAFDAVWKTNLRNTALLEQHILAPDAERRSNLLFGAALIIGVLTVIVGIAAAVYLLAQALVG